MLSSFEVWYDLMIHLVSERVSGVLGLDVAGRDWGDSDEMDTGMLSW